jgi:carbamoyltransferase
LSQYIIGLSAYYHDSAAALLKDGVIIAAAQEERFTRKKHDMSFPSHAVKYCLNEANICLSDVAHITFYDKPLLKFERLLETYIDFAPKGFSSFRKAMPVWVKDKLFLKSRIRNSLAEAGGIDKKQLPSLLFTEHHQSHAASAFFVSPFESAAVLCMDGVGEWATSSLWIGQENRLTPQWQINFPHSLGLLYSAFTYYIGFKVNSGEYKLMGLAPYGRPIYVDKIKEHLIHIKADGSFRLNMKFFNFATGLTMTSRSFHQLFGGLPRQPESDITQKEMDLAASIQLVTEEIVLQLADTVYKETGQKNLCLAGGVALNCVVNGRLQRESKFENIWIQPASGDAGGSIGAALSTWYEYLDQPRFNSGEDKMCGSFLGPAYDNLEIIEYLKIIGANYVEYTTEQLPEAAAKILEKGKVVGLFCGRMEFGPRALGHRSIIGDPRDATMQARMNIKIKNRESFRPFAPAVLREKVSAWFDTDKDSPYMLFVSQVSEAVRKAGVADENLFGLEKLNQIRSQIPAVTHVDYSARIQTVCEKNNPEFYSIINAFYQRTGCPVIINTSFNVRGEPIVCSYQDAFNCFMQTDMDALILNTIIINKSDLGELASLPKLTKEIELD